MFKVVKIEVKSSPRIEDRVKFLQNFALEDFSDFCLAFLFTYM